MAISYNKLWKLLVDKKIPTVIRKSLSILLEALYKEILRKSENS